MGVVFSKERHRPVHPAYRSALNLALTSLFAALLLVASSAAQGTVINAVSPSLTDVTAAIHSAADGDTVTIPKGTAAWTSSVKISKGITLIGQTTTDPMHKTADDQTIISVNTGADGNTPLLVVDSAAGKSYRVSGITFRTGRTGGINSNGMVQLNGNSQAVRLDHCHFDDLRYENNNIAVWGPIYGVADHNLFDFRPGNNTQSFYINMAEWGGRSYGDGSWAQPAYYGSEKFFFIEDNCFNNQGQNELAGVVDCWRGGRYVLRYNHVYNANIPQTHGTEIGRERGARCMEVYNNDFHWTFAPSNVGGIRSGGLITHDNTHDGVQPQRGAGVGAYRVFFTFLGAPFTGATGDNPWDYNVTEADGRHVEGHPAFLFESGTCSAGTNREYIVDKTKNWRPHQWNGYTAKRLSDGKLGLIYDNTNNTLKVLYHEGYGGGANWQPGEQYQIHKVLIAMDQACRGGGDLITGEHPINSSTRSRTWPHQTLEPCYSWNDIYTPTRARVDITLASGAFAVLQEGRDYYNNTPMPGYKPYTYPHPLTISLPAAQLSPSSQRHLNKSSEKTEKKLKTWKWGKAKENSASKTAKQVGPDHQ
jgi:hypothetical protein